MFVKIFTKLKPFLLILILCLGVSSIANAQLQSLSEPEVGEGFTDDYLVILGDLDGVENIVTLDATSNFGRAQVAPWSDSYWPVYKGLIAYRYADARTPSSNRWTDYYNSFQSIPSASFVHSGNVNALSPAEKYDLLVGDPNWSLTQYMWKKGQASMQANGVVATWTGICHGWSGASQVGIPRPESAVTVHSSVSNVNITFYPFDIQALVSYLWGGYGADEHFTGRRCRNSVPLRENGRPADSACLDVNPKTWHLSITNRIGRHGQPFIMDVSANAEVWNYVVDQYRIHYFNPQTAESSTVLEENIIPVERYTQDPYKNFRSPKTRYVVGVQMDVFYPGAITPHKGVPARQHLEWKEFIYDLELDAGMNVVGGEWLSSNHPDFIWLFAPERNPFFNPHAVEGVDLASDQPAVDPQLAMAAQQSSKRGRLVESIVYRILHKSLTPQP